MTWPRFALDHHDRWLNLVRLCFGVIRFESLAAVTVTVGPVRVFWRVWRRP